MAKGRGSRGKIFFILLSSLSLWGFFGLVLTSPSMPSSSSSIHSTRNGSRDRTFKFWISNDTFWKDNHPFQIIGGDVHYFRIHPQYWEDRLTRAKALGLNAIQTYVPWNLHEPQPKQWSFSGIADILSFLKISQELGLLVMLRVGPYICAEWDLGGFPAWLLTVEPEIRLRSSDVAFLELVERWWDILLPKIVPYLYENGGPIIMVQIENEFGSTERGDQLYLSNLVALARRHLGDDIILYTTDGAYLDNLKKGTIKGKQVLAAVDFSTGEDAQNAFRVQKMFNEPGKSPPLSSEFYTGWLTHWGEQIAKTDAEFTAGELQKILSWNCSAVLYMAHGGTNFGFYNGANIVDNASDYRADLTSYDYDAPIKESGDVDNTKFKALRAVIEKFGTLPLPPIPMNNKKTAYGNIRMKKIASLFDMLAKIDPASAIQSEKPLSMESVGQMFGFLLYMSEYPSKKMENTLVIKKLHDRGQIFVSCGSNERLGNSIYVGTIERWTNKRIMIPRFQCTSNMSLYILVENMGRVNYGKYIYDRKGILSDVLVDGVPILKWTMFPVPSSNLENFVLSNPIMQVADPKVDILPSYYYKGHSDSGIPGYYYGSFTIDQLVTDTFISLRGWNKGIVFVNNFNIGRFWSSVGPQCSLYVPAPILQRGINTVVIFELHVPNPSFEVEFVEEPHFSCG